MKNANNSIGVTQASVTTAAATSFAGAPSARMAELLSLLVKHSHAFIREGKVTHAEWRTGLEFLTKAAAITTEERNEFSLMSDIFGISSLVDLQSHAPGGTPGSVLGPFHNHDSHWRDNGADLISGQPGEPVLFKGKVCDTQGKGLANASIDLWQNADNALYPAQDASQDPHNLRCKIKCDADGSFTLNTVVPKPYTVPYDGPVGDMLTATKRHGWRPAHFHFIAAAPGFQSLVTEIFPEDSEYLESDAVFGVRPGLAIAMPWIDDEAQSKSHRIARPFRLAQFEFRLVAN
jgi:hydroxyquinol 1,2-dioxygenase